MYYVITSVGAIFHNSGNKRGQAEEGQEWFGVGGVYKWSVFQLIIGMLYLILDSVCVKCSV